MRRRTTFVAALLAVSLAGCGTNASSPSPVATPSPAATVVPSPSPTTTLSPSPTPTPTPTPTAEPTPTPSPAAVVDTPEPAATPATTDAPIPVLAGISDADVLAAGADAGLDCQNDSFGIMCSTTTSLGTDLELSSTGTGDGVQEVGITSTGEATEGHSFLVAMARALLGSRASSVVAWVGANEASSVVDKTFVPYYVTYRGPLDMADLSIQPAP